METAPATRQRSPWLYVLLGCGGLAMLLCLGASAFVYFGYRQVQSAQEGVLDPGERQKNALAQLGAIPPGYHVVASFSMFGLMKTTVLSDQPPLEDGGFVLGGRVFQYTRVLANDNNGRIKAYLKGESEDGEALRQLGFDLSTARVVKRGQLSLGGRSFHSLVLEGPVRTTQGQVEGLTSLVLFDCPDEALRFGVWLEKAPADAGVDLSLAGTVGDEAELARLLEPMNPCGK